MHLTCIHQPPGVPGLCKACQDDHDADPSAWLEFGQHEAGIAAWNALLDEIAREHAALDAQGPPPEPDPSIPF